MQLASLTNDEIAEAFDEIADLLEIQGGDGFRIRSYRRAARELRALDESAEAMARNEGEEALRRIPGIGERLAGTIGEFVETGRLGLLDRLRSEVSPSGVFTQLPGIGEELAERIYETLGVKSLEELERAAHDGRLEEVDGIGARTAAGMRDVLAGRLGRSSKRRARERVAPERGAEEPSVDLLLEVDRDYRQKAAADELRRIAPRRFNPEGKRWLPIMEVDREGWSCRALFSNTKRAHELDKTDDWVVIYFERGGREGQCTVVTAGSGALEGRRVIRGRESECREYYDQIDSV